MEEYALTNIYFIRHAEPNYDDHDDLTRELSPKGLRYRASVTAYLADKAIDAVLSSPYKRAVDTVKDFADAHGFDVVTVEDFRERRIADTWVEDFRGFTRRQWENFDFKLNDGESLREVQNRNIAALEEVLRRYDGKNAVIGSHGTALSTVIHHYHPSYGYADFDHIRGKMPFAVHFTFEGERCVEIEAYDLLEKTTMLYQ